MDLKESKLNEGKQAKRHPWELARIKVIADLIDSYLPALKDQEATILDVGCGDTYLIEQLSAKMPKLNFIAIDTAFDEEMLHSYRQRLKGSKIQVFDTLDNATPHIKGEVALVLLLDVIEHIADDISFLKWLNSYSCIGKETEFLITVPAFQSFFCSHDYFLEHYRRYTNASLEKHLKEAGMTDIRKGYFFSSLIPTRIIRVLMEKLIKPSNNEAKGIGAWEGGSLKSAILQGILRIDFKIFFFLYRSIGIKAPGLSNYALCKKRV